ncbi:MAG: iron-sulfur cluster assembly accessory protein [Bdellovibrionales bacterium]|jgi:iron-sulfur cluster assembly protein|nr:iron-sulfur cluster assembly accessory protein [Bdellovibrionales bacterium]
MSEAENIVHLTDKAKEQIKKIFISENKGPEIGLRLGVIGGGCSGLSYKLDFGDSKENDNIFNYEGFKVYIDPKSSIYLKGVTLDFQDGLEGKGFVFSNPSASNTCGCGESFSV